MSSFTAIEKNINTNLTTELYYVFYVQIQAFRMKIILQFYIFKKIANFKPIFLGNTQFKIEKCAPIDKSLKNLAMKVSGRNKVFD